MAETILDLQRRSPREKLGTFAIGCPPVPAAFAMQRFPAWIIAITCALSGICALAAMCRNAVHSTPDLVKLRDRQALFAGFTGLTSVNWQWRDRLGHIYGKHIANLCSFATTKMLKAYLAADNGITCVSRARNAPCVQCAQVCTMRSWRMCTVYSRNAGSAARASGTGFRRRLGQFPSSALTGIAGLA